MSYERPVTILASSLDRGMKTELCCLLDEVVLEVVSVLALGVEVGEEVHRRRGQLLEGLAGAAVRCRLLQVCDLGAQDEHARLDPPVQQRVRGEEAVTSRAEGAPVFAATAASDAMYAAGEASAVLARPNPPKRSGMRRMSKVSAVRSAARTSSLVSATSATVSSNAAVIVARQASGMQRVR